MMMRRILTLCAALAMTMSLAAQTPVALQVKQLRLSNGMTVWLNEDHSQPKVFGAVVVRAGAADCPNTGIAHYFEHIMFKGTDRIGTTDYAAERVWLDSISAQYDLLAHTTDATARTAIQQHINRLSQRAAQYAIPNDFSNLVTRYGGTALNAYTSFDQTVYHNVFAPQYISQWAMLNSERLLHPVFRLFQGELETVYEEKNRAADDLLQTGMEKIMATAFDGTPYAYPVLGSTDNLKNPQLSQMYDFYHRYYVAGNMGLILCGDIVPDSLAPLLERTFGRIRAGEAPARKPMAWRPYTGQSYDVRVPIPIISGELIGYKGPQAGTADAGVMTLAMQLLNNVHQTGRLDSLMADGRLLAAIAFCTPLRHAGFVGVGIVPNLLGKKSKAEDLCMAEIDRLRRGEFSDEALMLVKQAAVRQRQEAMEDIAQRAQLMVDVYANGMSWDEFLRQGERQQHITRQDIMDVVHRYMNGGYIRFVKRYGSYDKDRLSQPGYQPVVPSNVGARSAYADALASVPGSNRPPRFIDFARDATTTQIAPLATLYTVANPIDSLFCLDITYYRGSREDQRLDIAAQYAEQLGTSRYTRLQLSQQLQRLGASVSMDVGERQTTITVKGIDSQLAPTLALVAHMLDDLQADEKKLKEVKKQEKVGLEAFDKSNATVEEVMLERLKYGDRSWALCQPTLKEINAMTSAQLIQAIHDLRHAECAMVYSGTLDSRQVAAAVAGTLRPELATQPRCDQQQPLQPVAENTVYVYEMKDARQNLVGTYQQLAATPTADALARQMLFASYLGDGMSSVMFQELREFRSFAYTAYGYSIGASLARHPDAPTALLTSMGTQADKTLQAIGVLDSLMANLPMREANVEVAKTTLVNRMSNSYPSFRRIGNVIAARRAKGYDHDLNADLYSALAGKGAAEVAAYYRQQVQHAPRALYVIGKLSKDDMERLSSYGRVVVLRKQDLIRY